MNLKHQLTAISLACTLSIVSVGQDTEKRSGFLNLSWSHALYASSSPLSRTLLDNDTLNIQTLDSISEQKWGFEAICAFPQTMFIVGAQPPSTLIGDQSFRLRYTTINSNQIVTTTDSVQAHLHYASFFIGMGYRFGRKDTHTDVALIPYFEKQTGRFIVHDAIWRAHELQQDQPANVVNNLPDDHRVDLNELTQERTRNFAFGLRLQLTDGVTFHKGVGLMFGLAPRAPVFVFESA